MTEIHCPHDCPFLADKWPHSVICWAFDPPVNLQIDGREVVRCRNCPKKQERPLIDIIQDSIDSEGLI